MLSSIQDWEPGGGGKRQVGVMYGLSLTRVMGTREKKEKRGQDGIKGQETGSEQTVVH